MENTMIEKEGRETIFIEGVHYMSEQQMQVFCVRWFSDYFPSERGMLHCNNNNSSSRVEGNKNKALGVTPGVSDLELVMKHGQVAFIELKLAKGKLSEDQIKWRQKVMQRGHLYMTAFSFEEFKKIILNLYSI